VVEFAVPNTIQQDEPELDTGVGPIDSERCSPASKSGR
jgi:hypothetical protein